MNAFRALKFEEFTSEENVVNAWIAKVRSSYLDAYKQVLV
jgi:hypothetical protein